MTSKPLVTVDFHGHPLITLQHNGEPHVAVRPICEYIGLAWHGQYQRLQRHPVLAHAVVPVAGTTGADGKRYEMLCLPLRLLNGWLFGIDATRVKPELRERVVQYQRECFDVLAAYWQRTPAPAPEPAVMPGQAEALQMQRFMTDNGLITYDEGVLWRMAPGVMSRIMMERKAAEHMKDELLNVYRKLVDAQGSKRRRKPRAAAARQGNLL